MRPFIALVLCLFFGCVTSPPVRRGPFIPEHQWPELITELPPDPEAQPLPKNIPPDEWVESIEAREIAPRPGILLSEARSYRDGLYRIYYKALRDLDQQDRKVWGTHRALYENRLGEALTEIERLQPNWWERNALVVGLASGFVLGTLATIGVVAVVNKVNP